MNPYRLLFNAYVTDLAVAHARALEWWSELVKKETAAGGGTKAEAEHRIRCRWPFGPTLHPYVLAVYRRYYIECERLNECLFPARFPHAEETPVVESDWGVTDEKPTPTRRAADEDPEDAFWESIGPCDPPILLFDFLSDRDEVLGKFMTWLVFAPIGSENDISV